MKRKHTVDAVSECLIALGGNLPSAVGDPDQTLKHAIRFLVARGLELRAVSRFFITPCFPAGTGPDYANAVISVCYSGQPVDLLEELHTTEAEFLRVREQRWGMRTLDLDLLAFDAEVRPDARIYKYWQKLSLEDQINSTPDELVLPHPRIQDRAFVLIPLFDIRPDWKHPILGKSCRQLVGELSEEARAEVRPL